ncbi:MAG: formylglycine-generating enzyme family protein [Deltaproteobacteria bacterium]|nr:formylglycine-generating enzyme family protein [Deltaproteobacteria bacterium]
MKQALIVLVFLAPCLSFADAVFVDRIQKRYLVAYLDKGEVIVKACLVIPKEGSARDCGDEVVLQLKFENWLVQSRSVGFESGSKKAFTLDAVIIEIERLSSGDTVDPEAVDERLKGLRGLQQRLVLVAKVERALQSPDPELFSDVDWGSLAGSGGGFLEKLHTARRQRGDSCQYRLPTEEEWEYAARGGTSTDYSFGNDPSLLPEYGWFAGNVQKAPHGVAQLKKNPFGLYDMHGNVWEWTMTLHGSDRVFRGGSWNNGASNLRSASRDDRDPGNRYDVLGFRLLRMCL